MNINKSLQIIIHLLRRLAGVFTTVFAIYYALLLITFDINDPSFNTFSTEDIVKNFGGIYGARIADLSFQVLGLSSFVMVIFIFSLGLQMSNIIGVQHFLSKVIIIPICILSFSLTFALMPKPEFWEFSSLGGVNGSFLLLKLQKFPHYAIFLVSFPMSLILFSIIVEVSLKDWIYFFRFIFVWLRYIFEKYLLPKDLNLSLNNFLSKKSENIPPKIIDNNIIEDEQEFEENNVTIIENQTTKPSNEDLKTDS